jgi:hypothetical protein
VFALPGDVKVRRWTGVSGAVSGHIRERGRVAGRSGSVCQQANVTLPVDPRSVARAREFVAGQCVSWSLDGVCDDIVLPVSELVTNALLHGRTATVVTVSLTRRFLEVAVCDGNPRRPVVRPVRRDLLADIDQVAARLSLLPHDLRDDALDVGDGAGAITASPGSSPAVRQLRQHRKTPHLHNRQPDRAASEHWSSLGRTPFRYPIAMRYDCSMPTWL